MLTIILCGAGAYDNQVTKWTAGPLPTTHCRSRPAGQDRCQGTARPGATCISLIHFMPETLIVIFFKGKQTNSKLTHCLRNRLCRLIHIATRCSGHCALSNSALQQSSAAVPSAHLLSPPVSCPSLPVWALGRYLPGAV
jgi:hypothetical protein